MPDHAEDDRYDVFVSYARDDVPNVLSDVRWLESAGYDVWFDSYIEAGKEWANELASAIDRSRFVIFFASARSIVSPHCLNEVAYATDAHKVVVPIYLEQVDIAGGVKLAVSRSQAIMRWQLGLDEYRQQLRSVVERYKSGAHATVLPRRKQVLTQVPHTRNRNFAGRDELLAKIAVCLRERAPAVVALTGLAGVGKSQVALEYVYRKKREYDLVAWIRGEERAVLESDLVDLAASLGLEQAGDPDTALVLSAVKRHLDGRSGWLLIFDNVERPETLLRYLPADPSGHVIVTSRWRNWGRYAENLAVDPFESAEAIAFMERRLSGEEPAAVRRLVDELGRLPLALEEAAAYMEATGRSVSSYLELFENHHRALLDQIRPPDDYPWTFRTALEVSLQHLQTQSDAVHVLKLLAFVAPDDISVPLLLRKELETGDTPFEIASDHCVSTLAKYSLLKIDRDAVAVHRLVQLVVRDRLSADEYAHYGMRVLELVEEQFPSVGAMGELQTKCRKLVPHAIALFTHIAALPAARNRLAALMGRVGTFLSASSWSEGAIRYLDNAYSLLKDAGDASATFAYTCELFGGSLYRHGLLDRARELFDEAIETYDRCGLEKANRRMVIHTNLAWIHWSVGDFALAEGSARAGLATLEARDPRRIGALSILARVHADACRLSDAEKAVDECAATIAALHGYRTPLMCGVFMQMAHVLLDLGKPLDAQSWIREALTVGATALSESHPLMATSHCELGQILLALGERQAALRELEAAMVEVPDSNYRVSQHQAVAACFRVLALIDSDDLDAARTIASDRLATITVQIAGETHYAAALASLVRGRLECRLGHPQVGVELAKEGESGITRRYGEVHGHRLLTLALLGDVQRDAGLLDDARRCYERGLTIAAALGLGRHPSVADHIVGLAAIDHARGDAAAARAGWRKAADLLAACLGASCPRVTALTRAAETG